MSHKLRNFMKHLHLFFFIATISFTISCKNSETNDVQEFRDSVAQYVDSMRVLSIVQDSLDLFVRTSEVISSIKQINSSIIDSISDSLVRYNLNNDRNYRLDIFIDAGGEPVFGRFLDFNKAITAPSDTTNSWNPNANFWSIFNGLKTSSMGSNNIKKDKRHHLEYWNDPKRVYDYCLDPAMKYIDKEKRYTLQLADTVSRSFYIFSFLKQYHKYVTIFGYSGIETLLDIPFNKFSEVITIPDSVLIANSNNEEDKKAIKKLSFEGLTGKSFKEKSAEISAALSSGTALLISENGYVLTNAHVVSNAKNISFPDLLDKDGKLQKGEIVMLDESNDLAIVKLSKHRVNSCDIYLAQEQSDLAEPVAIMGYPMTDILGQDIRYNDGTLSALTGINSTPNYYQVSCTATHGNSGGPCFTNDGEVIGIVSSGLKGESNITFTVKSQYARLLISSSGEEIRINNKNKLGRKSYKEIVQAIKSNTFRIQCER